MKIIKRIANVYKGTKAVYKQVNDPVLSKTYFPEADRKTKFAIWKELMLWLVKHNEVNELYFTYGLDRKGKNASEIMPYWKFNALQKTKNRKLSGLTYDYVVLMRDKFIFAQFLTSLRFPTPKNLALFDNNKVTWLDTMQTEPLSSLINNTSVSIDGFAKKLAGMVGEGVFPLQIKEGRFYSGGTELTLDELQAKLDGKYLLQERISQHPQISKLHPESVNTIRIITFNNGDKIEVFASALRIGAKGQNTDNWGTGGIVVGIDKVTGKLQEYGVFRQGYGLRSKTHPDSGMLFKDYQIPFYKESVDLVCRIHNYLPRIQSVGWDIAITPDGPTCIEGNDNWGCGIPMVLEENFKSRIVQLFQKN